MALKCIDKIVSVIKSPPDENPESFPNKSAVIKINPQITKKLSKNTVKANKTNNHKKSAMKLLKNSRNTGRKTRRLRPKNTFVRQKRRDGLRAARKKKPNT